MTDGRTYALLKDASSIRTQVRNMSRTTNRSLRDPGFLKQVAAVYSTNPTGGIEAIRNAFDSTTGGPIHESTAKKYIQAARDARGLIEDRRRKR